MLSNCKKTKIVCTLGPASDKEEVFEELVENGLNVARFNFSHGDHEEQKARMDMVKKIRTKLQKPVAILLDTKGPEIRTGMFDGEVTLEAGQKFTITMDEVTGTKQICTVSYKDLAKDVKENDTILIDDGLVELTVKNVCENDIECEVQNTGIVKSRKGVNVPGVKINLPAITDKDISDIEFGIKQEIDIIAASFVRKASDVLAIREVLENNGAGDIHIISKIENQEGVENIEEILNVSDGIMVARGDLGVEIPTEEVPIVQKMIIKKCNEVAKPVVTATQMLDSMIRNPRPTRAEVTDVANAIYDGTDAIMLSGETAAGKYPVEAIKMMATIAKRTEETLAYDKRSDVNCLKEITITDAISHATCTTARDLEAKAIITSTSSGYTTRMVSKFRPESPIIAATNSDKIMRRLSLVWGAHPVKTTFVGSTDEVVESSIESAKKANFVKDGDLVVITAGVPVGKTGTTNLLKVSVISEFIGKGVGIGKQKVTATAKLFAPGQIHTDFNEGDIIVATRTDRDMIKYMEKASAIVTEAGGMTSHAAIVGINLGIPVIVSVPNVMEKIKDGDEITVDPIGSSVTRG